MTSIQHPPATQPDTMTDTNTNTTSIKTHHCRFCNHLLLATTRHLPSLPRRKEPARDAALILPLPVSNVDEEEEEEEQAEQAEQEEEEAEGQEGEGNGTTTQAQKQRKTRQKGKDYSILLSTTLPDRKPTLIRREDGFEKRLLLRCGRCRVGMGYFLDPVHFPDNNEEDWDGDAKVVYLLPGALMETGVMVQGDQGKMKAMDQEWAGWT